MAREQSQKSDLAWDPSVMACWPAREAVKRAAAPSSRCKCTLVASFVLLVAPKVSLRCNRAEACPMLRDRAKSIGHGVM